MWHVRLLGAGCVSRYQKGYFKEQNYIQNQKHSSVQDSVMWLFKTKF